MFVAAVPTHPETAPMIKGAVEMNNPLENITTLKDELPTLPNTDSVNSNKSNDEANDFWGPNSEQAIIIGTVIVEATERLRACKRDDFWDTINVAWAVAGSDAHAALWTAICDQKLDHDSCAFQDILRAVKADMPAMLKALESILDMYTADELRAWNNVASGLFFRMNIPEIRDVLATTDSEWALVRAWVIAAGLGAYLAVNAAPQSFAAQRGGECHEIIELAPKIHQRKFGQPLEAFTQ
jgi:hypothetical protein